ncbi:MAG TPA: hypothetical protein EYG86_01520, partial [Crocinitomicaceae bacterium]|nr:hypothetical protein [Crocinitomicaceae bacterium]
QKENKEEFNISNLIDVETERSLLRALIELDTEETLLALMKLKEDVFYVKEHKMIFGIIKNLDERNFKLQMETVRAEVLNQSLDCMDALINVAQTEPAVAIKFVSQSLEEWERKRKLYYLVKETMASLQEGTDSSYSVANNLAKKSDDIILNNDEDFTSYRDLKEKLKDATPLAKISTGMPFIDAKLRGGIEEGQFILLFGDTEAGKTLLGTQILRNVAKNFKAIFFPFEFSSRSFKERTEKNEDNFNHDNLFIEEGSADILDIEVKLKLFAKRGGSIALIDSQMMLTNVFNKGTSEERETEKFIILQRICVKYGLRIILIAQQGKEDTRSGTITPMKSKNGSHAAHQMWYIKKPKLEFTEQGEEKNRGEREFIFHKNKQTGNFGSKPIQLNYRTMEFAGRHFDEDDKRSKNHGSHRQPNKNKGVPKNIPSEGYTVEYENENEDVFFPGGLG